MANTLNPYPTEFMEAAKVVYDHVNGGTTTRNSAIHGAYQFTGAMLGRFVPDPDSGSPMPVGKDASKDDAVTCDDDTCVCEEVNDKKGMAALKKCCEMHGILDSIILKQALAFVLSKLTEWLMSQ